METFLQETDSPIWEFPSIAERDTSIVKYEYVKVYKDSHGAGALDDTDHFSFTTNNEDIWFLPTESYFSLTIKLRKEDGETFIWKDKAATQTAIYMLMLSCIIPINSFFDTFRRR
jgi:hypothetical protein